MMDGRDVFTGGSDVLHGESDELSESSNPVAPLLPSAETYPGPDVYLIGASDVFSVGSDVF